MAEQVKKTTKRKKARKPYNKDAAFQKQSINLLKDIADKLEFLCQNIKRNTGG